MDFEDRLPGPAPQLPREVFEKRRQAAAEPLDDNQLLVVATHPEVIHSNDVHHRFRPSSDFWYLTGFGEPEAVVVIEGDTGHSTVFLRHRKPEAEVWTGRRLGIERAAETLGVDTAYAHDEMAKRLPAMAEGRDVLAVAQEDPGVAMLVGDTDNRGRRLMAKLRVRKAPEELEMMRAAARLGMEAMEAALPQAKPGGWEFQVDAALRFVYHAAGSTGPAYPPIVGAGANAAVLHYIDNRGPIRDGDLVLVDAGCEWGYYASDITRTVPAGEWGGSQRRLYDIVRDAQTAAIAEVKPGNSFRAPHEAAVRVLTRGLVEEGILHGDVDRLIEDEAHRPFYMHGTSHFLGLDVHDVGDYKGPDGESRVLEPGMVLTVEPGLYFNPDLARLPDGVPPMGIRLENDIVVTEDGHEDLQADLTTDPDEWAERLRG